MDTEILELEIISRTESKKINVLWLEVESPTGNFVVCPDHSPLVSLLKDRGKLRYEEYQGNEQSIDTYGGILTVDGNKATVILK